jgi:hypothetical protein
MDITIIIAIVVVVLLCCSSSIYFFMSTNSEETPDSTPAPEEVKKTPVKTDTPSAPSQSNVKCTADGTWSINTPVDVNTEITRACPGGGTQYAKCRSDGSWDVGGCPPAKVFRRAFESDPNCCGGGGGEPSELVCPDGTFVKEFYGGAGALIDRVGVKCSNGTDLGTRGGGGGGPFSVVSDNGFNKIHVRSGALVDNIKFFTDNAEKGAFGGGGGEGPHDLNCGDGKIMGLKLRTGGLVDRIQVICGKN